MRLRKLWGVGVSLALVLSLLLAACGDSPTATTTASTQAATTTAAATASTTPVKLTMSIWGNDAHLKMYQDMATKFKEKNPNVTVEVTTIPFSDYQQKLSIQIASKTAPDIAWVADRMIPQFMEAGQLADITSLKDDPNYNLADFYPSTLSILKKGEQVLGIPFSTPPMMLFYNKNLFKEKGLKTPTELYKEGKWTYDEMLKAAKAISDPAKGVYGVKIQRDWKNWPDALMPLIWSYGGDVFSKDNASFALNSEQGGQALQIYSDMMFKDNVHPKPGDQIAFEAGKLGMYQDRYSYTSKTRPIKDFEWDIAPLPAGVSGTGNSLGLAAYTIIQGTKYPKEALEFLKFVSNRENMGITSQYFVPSRESVLNSDVFLKAAPQPSAESIKLAVIDQMKGSRYLPSHRNWAKIDAAVSTNLDKIHTQGATVKDALKLMEQQVTPLLK
jgi:multiple sugar transport system substrate-binding protein